MKNAFRNTVSHDKLRRLPTRKQVTSLLILTAIVAAIFATPTVSFARNNLSNGSSQSYIANITNHTYRSSKPTVPLTAIRMLDKVHGWALTSTSVLKTSDGGIHWSDVTSPNFPVHPGLTGAFMSQNEAWVVGVTEQELFIVQHTNDGGIHWQRSQFSNGPLTGTGGIIDAPHFLNAQEGWLDVQRNHTMGTGTTTNDVFHTTDGGSHWSKLATDEQIHQNASAFGRDTGISFKDGQNIWDTVDVVPSAATGVIPTNPVAYVTHDGGKTWQQQTLPSIPGLASTSYATTPPVFFGNYGLMPVKTTSTTSGNSALSIYVTNDGGIHWSSRPQTAFDAEHVYILDQQHIWVADMDGSIHESQNGGQSWNTLGSIGKNSVSVVADIDMSFTDPNTGWIVPAPDIRNGSRLLHTTDGGHTWQSITYSIQ